MTGFLIVIHTIVSFLLISVVLMQASQGGGLSGTFGGSAASSVLGGQNAGNVLSRITTWLATLFLSLAVIISMLSGPSANTPSSIVKQAAEERPVVPAQFNPPVMPYWIWAATNNFSKCWNSPPDHFLSVKPVLRNPKDVDEVDKLTGIKLFIEL